LTGAIPTDALARYLAATPEQRAAADRFLRGVAAEPGGGDPGGAGAEPGGGSGVQAALRRIEQKVDALRARLEGGAAGREAEAGEREAERVFRLLQRLEGGPKQRKAPLPAVFRLLVLGGLSQRAAAARCGCAESLISARAAAIERAFGLSLERLRSYAAALSEMERAVRGDRRRRRSTGRPEDFERSEAEEEGGF
jgi:hypothetical protein